MGAGTGRQWGGVVGWWGGGARRRWKARLVGVVWRCCRQMAGKMVDEDGVS